MNPNILEKINIYHYKLRFFNNSSATFICAASISPEATLIIGALLISLNYIILIKLRLMA